MMGLDGPPVVIGVLRLQLAVPGARSLKERRRVVVSLRDRLRARFDVSCHELPGDEHARAALVVTTGGGERSVIRSVLDRVRAMAEASPGCLVLAVDDEVRGWPDPAPWQQGDETDPWGEEDEDE